MNKRNVNQSCSAVASTAAHSLLVSVLTALAMTGSMPAKAENYGHVSLQLPVVKALELDPGPKVQAGTAVVVRCIWEGQQLENGLPKFTDYAPNNPKGAKLKSQGGQLYGEIRVNNKPLKGVVSKTGREAGVVAAAWGESALWENKSVTFECVIDKTGYYSKSSKSATLQVVPKLPVAGGWLQQPATGAAPAQRLLRPPATPDVSATGMPGAGLPDVTAFQRVTIDGKTNHTAFWGAQGITLQSSDATAFRNGLCEFTLDYLAMNKGLSPSGDFQVSFASSAAPVGSFYTLKSIPAGGDLAHSDKLLLKPGPNTVKLVLDHTGTVKELSEQNNGFSMPVTVSGTCGVTERAAPGARAQPLRSPPQGRTPRDREPAETQPALRLPVLPRP